MKSNLLFMTLFIAIIHINCFPNWNTSEITGYHFHTYFFQHTVESTNEAVVFR